MVPETTIVIPVWDGTAQTPLTQQIASAILYTTPGSFQLIMVDNASPSPATRALLRRLQADPRFRLISNEVNRGYGPALNQGLHQGYEDGSTFFLCMNNDIIIRSPDWLERGFLQPLREKPRSLVGARLIDFNDLTDFGDGPVPYLEGWCLAFRRCFLEEVGYFDERIFAWFEDVELTLRAQLRGYEVRQSPAFSWRNDSLLPLRGSLIHLYGQTGFRRGLNFERLSSAGREIARQTYLQLKGMEEGACG